MSSSASLIRFDDLLEYRIKVGKYHLLVFLTCCLIYFIDGVDIVCLALTLPPITKEWNISETNQSLISSVPFIGGCVGSILCGWIAYKFGRRKVLLWSLLCQFLLSFTSAYIDSVISFIVVKFIIGLMIGIMTTIAPLTISEIMPLRYRGQAVILVIFFTSIGKLYACIVAWFALTDLEDQNWRKMIFWSAAPAILGWIGVYFFTFKSPRYEIVMGRVGEGVAILNQIGQMNDEDFVDFDERIIEDMRRWQMTVFKREEASSALSLLKGKYSGITFSLSAAHFSMSFIYYGTIFILPEILWILFGHTTAEEIDTDLSGNTIAVLGELPSAFTALFIVENKFFGRKNSLFYGTGGCIVLFLLSSISSASIIIFFIAIVRYIMRMMLAIVLLLAIELYPTHCRAYGVGIFSAMGRLGRCLMPWFCIFLLRFSPKAPLLGFACGCTLVMAAIHGIPYDTIKRYLDTKGNEVENYIELPNMRNWEEIDSS